MIGISILFVVLLAACGGQEPEPLPDDLSVDDLVNIGRDTVQKSCVGCHGNDLAGRGANPSILNMDEKYTREELYDIIKNGLGGRMPGGLARGSEEAVVEYLLTLSE